MNRAALISLALLATPAGAGESIIVQPLPYTMECLAQYSSLESCIAGLVTVAHELTVQRDALRDTNAQLAARARVFEDMITGAAAPVAAAAPVKAAHKKRLVCKRWRHRKCTSKVWR